MYLATGTMVGADYFILVGYFVLMLGIGGYFYRYMRRMKDFFSGGNTIPWWLSGVSFYMSCFSVFGFVAYSALAFQYGWVAVTLFWVMAPATLVSVLFFSARWRRARIDSPVEYLETRYSPAVRQLFAWQGLPVRIIDDALKLVAIGMFISKGLDVNREQSMLWSGLIMLAYTFMGGLWAVTVTDFIQFVVMIAGVVVLLPLAIHRAGGLATFFEDSPEGFFQLISPEYNWFYLASMIFLFCLAFSSVNWALIQRYYCVEREKDTHKVGWLVVFLTIIGPPLILLPAMAARHFLVGVEDANEVYPMLCKALLPAGMLGLIIAAMFSATMSMLSSDYNVCASVLTNDVYRRYIKPNASQTQLVWVGRLMTLVVGLTAMAVAFLMLGIGGDDLFRSMVTLFSVATAPVALPMIAGLLSRRISNNGALLGCLTGVLVGLLVLKLAPNETTWWGVAVKQENIILWATTFTTLIMMTIGSLLLPKSAREVASVEDFHTRLKTPIGQLPDDIPPSASEVFSPFGIVGVCTAIIGVMMLVVLPWVRSGLAFGMAAGTGMALLILGVLAVYASHRHNARLRARSGEAA